MLCSSTLLPRVIKYMIVCDKQLRFSCNLSSTQYKGKLHYIIQSFTHLKWTTYADSIYVKNALQKVKNAKER